MPLSRNFFQMSQVTVPVVSQTLFWEVAWVMGA